MCKFFITAMIAYAKAKCAEQKQLCADEAKDFCRLCQDFGREWILKAKEPEFE